MSMTVFGKYLYLCRSAIAAPTIPTTYDFISGTSAPIDQSDTQIT